MLAHSFFIFNEIDKQIIENKKITNLSTIYQQQFQFFDNES